MIHLNSDSKNSDGNNAECLMIARLLPIVHSEMSDMLESIALGWLTPARFWWALLLAGVASCALVICFVPAVPVTIQTVPTVFWPFLMTGGINHVMGEVAHAWVGHKLPLMRFVFFFSHVPLGIAAAFVTSNGLFWFPFFGLIIAGLAVGRLLKMG